MSSSALNPASIPDKEEITVGEAFLICVALVGTLVGLLILKFFVNLLIDVLVLGNMTCTCRSLFCCFSSVESSSIHLSRSAGNSASRPASAHCSAQEVDVELSTIAVLREILPEHFMTQTDWENLVASQHPVQSEREGTLGQQASKESESGAASSYSEMTSRAAVVVCSICLQELHVGMLVHKTERCRHFFHAHCIREWLVGSNYHFNNHCPNCRAQLVDPAIRSKLVATS